MQEVRTDDPYEAPSPGEDFTGKVIFKLNFGGGAGVLENMCKCRGVNVICSGNDDTLERLESRAFGTKSVSGAMYAKMFLQEIGNC